MSKLSYKSLFIIFFFLLIGVVILSRFILPNKTVSASWWNESWSYRKAISLTNSSGSDLTDFQVSVSIGTSQLIADGKMQSNCNDIRFTDQNGNLLPHWIETNGLNACNQANSIVWVKTTLIPTSGSTLYLYYGNSSANSISSGDNVFIFFDDFNNSTIDTNKWNLTGDMVSISENRLRADRTNGTGSLFSKITFARPFIIDMDFYPTQYPSGWEGSYHGTMNFGTFDSNKNTEHTWTPYGGGGNSYCGFCDDGGCYHGQYVNPLITGDTLYKISMQAKNLISGPQGVMTYSNRKDDGTGSQANDTIYTGATTGADPLYIGVKDYGGNISDDFEWDNWRIRKYALSEPTLSLQPEELSPAPIAYWKFDEGVGTTAYDSTSTITGLLTGSTIPIWQNEDKCISGKCLDFNGSGYINVGNPSSFDIPNNSITIETWVKFNYLDYTNNTGGLLSLIGKGHPDTAPGTSSFGFWLTYDNRNNRNSFTYTCFGNSAGGYAGGVNNFSTSNYNFEENTWYHIAVTISQNEGRLFINGKQIGETRTFSGLQINNTTDNLYIGRATAGFNNGLQDEVKIYPYARTPEQIKLDYNSRGSSKGSAVNLGVKSNTAPSLKSGLVAYWKFDENNGTTVYDSSGNNTNGTFIGTTKPTWQNGKYKSGVGFSGVNDSIALPYRPDFRNAFSASIWFKRTTDYNQTADVMLLSPPNAWYFYDSYNSGAIRGDVYIDGTRRAGINVPVPFDGNWYHIVYTYDSATRTSKMYKNGKLYQSVDLTSLGLSNYLIDSPTGNLYNLGNNSKNRGIIIDEAKIYNRALTPQEILQDYNQGSAVQMGSTNQTIGGTTTSLEYCIPGDTSYCAPPIAEWKMDERAGTSISDTSGNNNNGTFGAGNSAPTWTIGKIGAGLNFDGVNDFVNAGDNSSLNFNTNSFSVFTWVKLNANTANQYFINGKSIGSSRWHLYVNSGNVLSVWLADSNGTTANTTIGSYETNQWYYLGFVRDKSTGKLHFYKNGLLISTVNDNTDNISSQGVFLGAWGGSLYWFNGQLDHTKIYNYARTPAQIAYDYNKGAPVAHWRLDDCQGNIVKDASGNNNHGTINIGSSGTQNSLGTCQVGTSAAWTNGATGKINSSLNFDGTDDYISMGDPANGYLDFGLDDFSTSAWFKTNTTNTGVILGKYNAYPLFYTRIGSDGKISSRIGFDSSTNFEGSDGSIINDNKWHHIITVYKRNGNMTRYIDGAIYGSAIDISSVSSLNLNTSNHFTLGSTQGGSTQLFSGQIDDVRIYNYALTSEQIKQIYNGGAVNFQ